MIKRIAIIFVTIFLILFVGCLPTPTTETVVNKAEQRDVFNGSESNDSWLNDLEGIPSNWTTDFSFREGAVSVEVNAFIEFPDVDRFPIVEVAPVSIDPQNVAQLLYKLIPDGSIRISDHGGKDYSLEDVDQWIEEEKWLLEHTNEMSFDSPEDRDDYINTHNAELERLFELRKTASPETVTMLDSYELIGRYGAMEESVLDADGNECAVFMWKPQMADGDEKRESVMHIDSLRTSCALSDHGIQSKEDAKLMADALIKEMGLAERYACVSIKEGANTIQVYYGLQYSGIKYSPFVETVIDYSNLYSVPWPNEMLSFRFVKQDGKTSVDWVCPSRIIGEKGEANLLPFSEIQSQFEKNLKATYSWTEQWIVSTEIKITRISLGYYRVPVKGKPDSYELIPAWTFEGTRTTVEKNDSGSGTYTNENSIPNGVLMVLSGLDGSLLYYS